MIDDSQMRFLLELLNFKINLYLALFLKAPSVIIYKVDYTDGGLGDFCLRKGGLVTKSKQNAILMESFAYNYQSHCLKIWQKPIFGPQNQSSQQYFHVRS